MVPTHVATTIQTFAKQHGRNWKSRLRKHWDSGQDVGAIREARNWIGPSGLNRFDLKTGILRVDEA